MILAIERNSFNYLYKYNQIKFNIDNLIDISFDDNFIKNKIEFLVKQFDRALPLFEEDHELLLLEVNKNELDFNGTISLTYKAVLNIFPLTSIGKRLLEGRLNKNLIIGNPIFENVVEEVKINRSIENRILATKKLHSAFSLHPLIKTIDFNIIKSSVINILKGNHQGPINFLQELIEYNKTPNYIPDGNIEYLLKIGLIAIKSMGKDESIIQNGPYYQKSIGDLKLINNGTLKDSYERFRAIKDGEFQKSLNGICTQISTSTKDVDIFKVSYYYIAFKNYLLKNDFNLIGIGSAIKQLIKEDNVAASWVLTLLGYSFSFEKLYETLHKLDTDQVYLNNIQKTTKDERKVKDVVNDPPDKKYRQKLDDLSSESNRHANPSNSIKSPGGNEFIVNEPSVENLKLTDSGLSNNYTKEKEHSSLLNVPEKIGDNEEIFDEGQTTDIENAQNTIVSNVSNEGIDQIESNDNYNDSIDSVTVKVSDLLIKIGQRKLNKKLMNLIGSNFDPKSSISLTDFKEFIYTNKKSFDTDTIDIVEKMFKGNLS